MTSSHRNSRRCYNDRRSRSSEREYRKHRSRRSRRSHRSRSDSSDHYRYRSSSRSRSDRGRSNQRTSYGARIRVDSPEPSRCLGVFGLSVYTTEPYLKDIFSRYGTVEKVFVIYDPKTKLSRGFGFVYFQTQTEATWARIHCNHMEFHGRRIRVDYSITEQPHPSTPGIYKGRI